MQLFGATLELIDSKGLGVTPDLVPKGISLANEWSKQPGVYWIVVTVACYSGLKYLSTGLYSLNK